MGQFHSLKDFCGNFPPPLFVLFKEEMESVPITFLLKLPKTIPLRRYFKGTIQSLLRNYNLTEGLPLQGRAGRPCRMLRSSRTTRSRAGYPSCTWRSTPTTVTGLGPSAPALWTARRCASLSTRPWWDRDATRWDSCGVEERQDPQEAQDQASASHQTAPSRPRRCWTSPRSTPPPACTTTAEAHTCPTLTPTICRIINDGFFILILINLTWESGSDNWITQTIIILHDFELQRTN